MTNRNKTLVTGAAGFIGSHVVRELLAQQREVKAIVLPGENLQNLDGLDVEIVEADITDGNAMHRVMQGVNRVYHLAAIYAFWLPRREKMYEVNCLGSMNVLWAALKADVEKVVYTSSIAAIGYPGKGQIADETTPFNNIRADMDYTTTKWLSEMEAHTFAQNGLPIVFCLPSGPIGPRDVGPTPTGRSLIDVVNGAVRFYINSGICFADVRDIAQGHVLAEEKGKVGERYLLAAENLTFKDYFSLINQCAGVDRTLLPVPMGIAGLAGHVLEAWAEKTGNPPLITAPSVKVAQRTAIFDGSKATRELGLQYRPIKESIKRALVWFADNGYIRHPQALANIKQIQLQQGVDDVK